MEINKILFADDDFSIRSVYPIIFEKYFPEYELEIFEDGTSLEERLERSVNGVKMIITDNNMPGITGSEIIRKYAPREEFSGVKFLLHYGGERKIGEDLKEECNLSNVNYIRKPMGEIEDFVSRIRTFLES